MTLVNRLFTHTFLIGLVLLFALLFIGHLKVESVPMAPEESAQSEVRTFVSHWQAERAQYDPTYLSRIEPLDTVALDEYVFDEAKSQSSDFGGRSRHFSERHSGCGRDEH